ncbi:helix-turn-helix transcriptional regulator [Paenibacillus hodogayensis]|uniref:Helix-turn-helix transcriptional regulator n=1 Tax=Paenibacillus hodogayensis TaxID=279208 RepID=A0ABV5W495_9BACL
MDSAKQRYIELGDFLKTRRARISPSRVGLPEGGRRRIPGLRREEVASLAGIGVTWYTWLEQGRPIQVSAQLLESLARVLMLDKEETVHLYTLARQAPPVYYPAYNQTIHPMHQHVLDSLTLSPSLILDTRWNVIAWNRAASLVFLDYSLVPIGKRNLIRLMFTDSPYRQLFDDWELYAQGVLARFRAAYGKYVADPWLVDFVEELRSLSKEFDRWWPMHNVEKEQEKYKIVRHPALGQLDFEHTSYLVSDDTSLRLYVNTPMAGTGTGEKIRQLLGQTAQPVC